MTFSIYTTASGYEERVHDNCQDAELKDYIYAWAILGYTVRIVPNLEA